MIAAIVAVSAAFTVTIDPPMLNETVDNDAGAAVVVVVMATVVVVTAKALLMASIVA